LANVFEFPGWRIGAPVATILVWLVVVVAIAAGR
jgi:hypothetical protein